MSTQRPQPQRPVKPPNPLTPITRSGPQPKFGGGNEQPPSIKKDYLEWKRKNRGTIQTPRPSQPGPGLFPPKTKEQNGGKTRRRKGTKSKRSKRSHKKTRNTRKKSKSHRKRR